jgi:hypothetical protein
MIILFTCVLICMREHETDSRSTSLVSDKGEDNEIECCPLRTLYFGVLACDENGEMHCLLPVARDFHPSR